MTDILLPLRRRLRMPRTDPPKYLRRPLSKYSWALGQTRGAPMPDSKHVVQQHRRGDVEDDKRPPDAEIPPAVVVADVDGGEELIRVAEGAVATV